MTTRVQRWGNSLALRIPKAIAEELRLSDNSDVEIRLEGGALIVKPSRSKRYSLADSVEKITGENTHQETDWGKSVGAERSP